MHWDGGEGALTLPSAQGRGKSYLLSVSWAHCLPRALWPLPALGVAACHIGVLPSMPLQVSEGSWGLNWEQ